MPHNGRVTDEGLQVRGNVDKTRRVTSLRIGDTGETRNELRDMPSRINDRGPLVFHPVPLELHRPDFDNHVSICTQTGRLNIYGYNRLHKPCISASIRANTRSSTYSLFNWRYDFLLAEVEQVYHKLSEAVSNLQAPAGILEIGVLPLADDYSGSAAFT